MTDIDTNETYKHPVMEPVVNATERVLESRRIMRAAAIGSALFTAGDIIYIATNEATANGSAGTLALAAGILSVQFARFSQTAVHE